MKREETTLAEKMAKRDIVLYVEGNRTRNKIIGRLESYDNINTDEIIEPATSLSSFKALTVGIGPLIIDHETYNNLCQQSTPTRKSLACYQGWKHKKLTFSFMEKNREV